MGKRKTIVCLETGKQFNSVENAAKEVVERFGEERMNFVMANTIRELSHDGRFSRQNKDWAEHIRLPR